MPSPATHETRSVLITGCSSGIGLDAARTLRARGWQVVASARDRAAVERLRAEGLDAVVLDVADSTSLKAGLAAALERTGGRLDALFNNAGYGQLGAIEDLAREVLREQFETNFFGAIELGNAVVPIMRAQGAGRIVQNSSVLGLVTGRFRGAYCATKYALEAASDALRLELAGSGVYVSLIEPGPTLTRFRPNAHKVFRRTIDCESSPHRRAYSALDARLQIEGPVRRGTVGPDRVTRALIHALESPRPKPRYAVHWTTFGADLARRLLPTRWLDRLRTR
ncbi:MAG: SDR family NAD(P)-dependent oxidoreductase [Chromatiales bacterium]|nr:SDR family NAD(P)-dependent oxidoreductase [Chromatiales bacterium]